MGRRSLVTALVSIAVLADIFVSASVAVAAPRTHGAIAIASARGRPVVDSVTPTAGPAGGGTTVTIRGARFANVRQVTIGSRKAQNVHVLSSHVLTAVTPSHAAGEVSISIEEKATTSPASAMLFHYLNRPRISRMTAQSGPVTGGQIITIDGRNLSNVRFVSFGGLHAAVLAHSTRTRLRLRTPASWAGTVRVVVVTKGGSSPRSAADLFTFRNPARRLSGQLTPATGDMVATGSDVTAVTGGQVIVGKSGANQAPWLVTLSGTATVPAVGQQYLLRPGGLVYPAGLVGTVTAVDNSQSPATITVSAPSGSLDSAVRLAQAVFSGPLGDGGTSSRSLLRPGSASAGASALSSTVNFGSISASTLNCLDPEGRSVNVTGSLALKLEHVEAHVQVHTGSLLSKPFFDVWISYQPTLAISLTAEAKAQCTLPAAWQNTHEKLFVLGDTGSTIAIMPDAAFTVSAGGTVSFQQHSYRILGFMSNPDGSIKRLDGQSSDPAQVKISGEIRVEAYGGVQIQVGELNVIGVGMSLDGGVVGTASSDWPPQVCLSANPFLRGTLYAYLDAWVREWKLQGFSVQLNLPGISNCSGTSWHVAWQSGKGGLSAVACPAVSSCFAVGRMSGHGYILRTTNGGRNWTATTIAAHSQFYALACATPRTALSGVTVRI